ncbi:MAG: glycosyltransferase family 39 protein [Anaerolineae bacterium]
MTSLQHTAAQPRPSFLSRLWNDPAVRFSLFIFVVIRVLTAITAYATTTAVPRPYPVFADGVIEVRTQTFIVQGALRAWFDPWYRYDTGWYISIAYQGYQAVPASIIFAPLYPLLLRLTSVLTGGDYLVAGILVSNVACVLMLILFYKLVAREFDNKLAELTLILYASFPTAFYLVAAYTESTFMVFALGAWLATLNKRYWLAGLLAFLASLTRSQAWVLALPFAYIILERMGEAHGGFWQGIRYYVMHPIEALRIGLPQSPAVIGGPLGAAVYFLGMVVAGLGHVEEAFLNPPWDVRLQAPWESLFSAARVLLDGTAKLHDIASIAVFVFIVVMGILALRYLKPPYWLLVFPTLLFIMLRGHDTFQFHGILRYVLYMVPAFMMLALLLRNQNKVGIRLATSAWVIIGILLQLALVSAFSLWGWVS